MAGEPAIAKAYHPIAGVPAIGSAYPAITHRAP